MSKIVLNGNDLSSLSKTKINKGVCIIPNGTIIIPSLFSLVLNGKPINKIIFGEGLIEIQTAAFAGFLELKKIEIPTTVKILGDSICAKCKNLEEAIISEGISILPFETFSDCVKLYKVTLPSSLIEIGSFCFSNCESLKEIIIPNNVEIINMYAFSNCINLEKIVLGDEIE